MPERQRIYVAGPYSAETRLGRRENTMRAIDAGIECLAKGHDPFIPHLTHFVHERALDRGVEFEYETWLDYDEQWLRACDWFLHLSSSPGADAERDIAEDRGMRVFESPHDIPPVPAHGRATPAEPVYGGGE
jgi:hypothetical protein